MRDLIEKLCGAEKGSRELDDAVWAIKHGYEFKWCDGARPAILVPSCACEVGHKLGEPHWRTFKPGDGGPNYTSSVNAALSLLPDDANSHGYEFSPFGVVAYFSRNNVKTGHWMVEGEHRTSIPIAFCIAALSRLLARAALNAEEARDG